VLQIGVIISHGWGPQREALLTIAAGIVLNDPHQNGYYKVKTFII
jgi:hypothetical protein